MSDETGAVNALMQIVNGPGFDRAFEAACELFSCFDFSALSKTPQDPAHHGEGDILTHTRMVCRALWEDKAFQALDARERALLFSSALLHDIGKIKTTRVEAGSVISPNHARTGSSLIRETLWSQMDLCGDGPSQSFRETLCALVRWHMLPMHLADAPDAPLRARKAASLGELLPLFTWRKLLLLARTDALGRVCADRAELLEKVELALLTAEESGCLGGPWPFPDAHTRRAYLSGRRLSPSYSLYDDSWGEVLIMCGLPGTGKDYWLRHEHPELPCVSLDDIRRSWGVAPEKPQGAVAAEAKARARAYLRKRQSFAWNATSLTPDTRAGVVTLCEAYGARVKIVYLETREPVRQHRNAERKHPVPEHATRAMLSKLTPPQPWEADKVEWKLV